MKTMFLLVLLLGLSLPFRAEDVELDTYRAELSRALYQDNADSLATAYCHLAEYYAYRDNDSARHFCLEGLKYANRKYPEPYLFLLNDLAVAYFVQGDMPEALRAYRKAYDESLRLGYSKDGYDSSVLSSIGVTYRRLNNPDSALYYYEKALSLLGEEDACSEEVYLLTNIAVLYANTSRVDEAEQYARRAMKAASTCEDMDMMYYAHTTAGAILTKSAKYDEAARVIYPALARARKQDKPRFELKAITYLLSLYHRLENNDSIQYYMKEAEKVIHRLPSTSAEVQGHRETLSEILSDMGRYRESLDLLQSLLAEANVNSQMPVDKLYLRMARDHHALGHSRQASECYERAYALADSLHASKVETRLSEFTVKYETKEKELEIARLNEAALRQEAYSMRWTVVAVIAIAALLVGLLWYLFRRRRIRKEEELKLSQSYIEGLERERARLAKDLHDGVCNDLLGIGMRMQYIASDDDIRQLLKLTEQVREDVRYISHELMPPNLKNATLAEIAEAYVERLALPAGMQFSFGKEEHGAAWADIPEQTAYETYRILQEALSNIMKYAQATEVRVKLDLFPDRLLLRISNNGKKYDTANGHLNGTGIATMHERAKAIAATLTMESGDGRQAFCLEARFHDGKP